MADKKPFGHPHFFEIIEEIKELHSRKNKQYAETGNWLGNFMRGGQDNKETYTEKVQHDPYLCAAIYAMNLVHKQIDGLKRMVIFDKVGTPDSIQEKCRDVMVYYGLIECILKEREKAYEKESSNTI